MCTQENTGLHNMGAHLGFQKNFRQNCCMGYEKKRKKENHRKIYKTRKISGSRKD